LVGCFNFYHAGSVQIVKTKKFKKANLLLNYINILISHFWMIVTFRCIPFTNNFKNLKMINNKLIKKIITNKMFYNSNLKLCKQNGQWVWVKNEEFREVNFPKIETVPIQEFKIEKKNLENLIQKVVNKNYKMILKLIDNKKEEKKVEEKTIVLEKDNKNDEKNDKKHELLESIRVYLTFIIVCILLFYSLEFFIEKGEESLELKLKRNWNAMIKDLIKFFNETLLLINNN
jgi:hypothetical protein